MEEKGEELAKAQGQLEIVMASLAEKGEELAKARAAAEEKEEELAKARGQLETVVPSLAERGEELATPPAPAPAPKPVPEPAREWEQLFTRDPTLLELVNLMRTGTDPQKERALAALAVGVITGEGIYDKVVIQGTENSRPEDIIAQSPPAGRDQPQQGKELTVWNYRRVISEQHIATDLVALVRNGTPQQKELAAKLLGNNHVMVGGHVSLPDGSTKRWTQYELHGDTYSDDTYKLRTVIGFFRAYMPPIIGPKERFEAIRTDWLSDDLTTTTPPLLKLLIDGTDAQAYYAFEVLQTVMPPITATMESTIIPYLFRLMRDGRTDMRKRAAARLLDGLSLNSRSQPNGGPWKLIQANKELMALIEAMVYSGKRAECEAADSLWITVGPMGDFERAGGNQGLGGWGRLPPNYVKPKDTIKDVPWGTLPKYTEFP